MNASMDTSCEFNNIKTQIFDLYIRFNDNIFGYLVNINFDLVTFVILKNEMYISSLTHESIFEPLDECMNSL